MVPIGPKDRHRLKDRSDMSPSFLFRRRRVSQYMRTGRTDGEETYLGLIRCRIVPRKPSRTRRLAAATYAQPRNGFFPPIHDTVEMTIDFVPENERTGKSAQLPHQRSASFRSRRTMANQNILLTEVDDNLIAALEELRVIVAPEEL